MEAACCKSRVSCCRGWESVGTGKSAEAAGGREKDGDKEGQGRVDRWAVKRKEGKMPSDTPLAGISIAFTAVIRKQSNRCSRLGSFTC